MSNNKRWLYIPIVVAMALALVVPLVVTGASQPNGITTPKDGATVSGAAEVTGFAEDPNFLKWQLDILPGGDANSAIYLAAGTQPGAFTYALDSTQFPNGEHALRLRVVRTDSNYDEYLNTFTIANAAPASAEPAATTPAPAAATPAPVASTPVAVVPPNGISSPKDGATVSGGAEVTGFADDANFLKWQLDVLPGGDANSAIFLAVGAESGAFTYALDSTQFPNGEHTLRLRVVRTNSNYDEYLNKFTIANGTPVTAEPAATTPVPVTSTPAPVASTPVAVVTPNGISNPKDGATVSGAAEVTGFADDANFLKWQIDVLPGGDANSAIFLAAGSQPGAFTYTLDSTKFPNGEHALRLRVVRTDSNYDEYVNKFTIKN